MKNRLKKLLLIISLGTVMSFTVLASETGTNEQSTISGNEQLGNGEESSGGSSTEEHNCQDFKKLDGELNPTCTEGSTVTISCSKCGANLGTESKDALGHDFNGTVSITKQPTCYSEGTKTTQCTRCSEVKSESIPKTSHQMSGWQSYSKATKCTEKDKEINKCLTNGCTHQEIRETSTKGPCEEKSERKNVKTATCKEEGYSGDVVCKHCDRIITKGSTLSKTEHVASSTLKNKVAATCSKEGYSGDLVCKYCDTVIEKGVSLSKIAHEKDDTLVNVKEATCKEEGYTGDKKCKNCDAILEYGEKIKKKEHVDDPEVKNRKDATCSVAGYSGDIVCKNCGEVTKKGSATLTTAHTPKLINAKDASCKAEGYTGDEVCEKCALKLSIGKIIPKSTNHTFGEWTVIQEATETTKGTETRECEVCHNVESRNIPKLGDKTEDKPIVDNTNEEETNKEENIIEDNNEQTPEENNTTEIEIEEKSNNTLIKVIIVIGLAGLTCGLGAIIYFKKFRQ